MQYQKLTAEQKRIRKWRLKRNALVAKLQRADPKLTSAAALAEANRRLRDK